MYETKAYHIQLQGSNYEVGTMLGNMVLNVLGLADKLCSKEAAYTMEEEKKMYGLFQEFCPGINEEIAGFADTLKIPTSQVLYYLMTYLRPGCSQMVLLPSMTSNGHVLMARNYDFSDQVDDMTLYTTMISGRYAHIGSALMQFGRADGMNEHGLAVSQTSAGLPVGEMEFARKPAIIGLQFWAVIRSILENCKNVDEAVYFAQQMPIAYNINMLMADKAGKAVLLETFNGEKAVKRIDVSTEEQFLCSTNHVHLPELKHYDPMSMRNSVIRYELIGSSLKEQTNITKEDLQALLSRKYPDGLCCHYYDEFFGNLRGMVFDLNEGTVEMCFGSPALNQWHTLRVQDEVKQIEYPVILEREKMDPEFYEMI